MKRCYRYRRRGFDFTNTIITKREIIASVSIVAIMLLFGVLISSKISEHQMDKNEMYNKAIKIESVDLFTYGMKTNVGNAFVYGDLKAVDTVNYPEIGGKYMYVEKVKEEYTRHERVVTKTKTVNGKTQTYTEIEVYWSWDVKGSEDQMCKQISFCGVTFGSSKISIPTAHYIDTIKVSHDTRYKYYGTGTEFTGTIFTTLKNNTIKDNTPFYNQMTIEQTVDFLEFGGWTIIFWIVWVLITGVLVCIFFVNENRWLD